MRGERSFRWIVVIVAVAASLLGGASANAATYRVPLGFFFSGGGPVLAGDSVVWLVGTGMSHATPGKPVRFDFALRRAGSGGRVQSIAFHRAGVPRYSNYGGEVLSVAASASRVAYAAAAYTCDIDLCRPGEDNFGGTVGEAGWGSLTGPLTTLDASCRVPDQAPDVGGYNVAVRGTAVVYVDTCANVATWIDDPKAPAPRRVRIVPESGEFLSLGGEFGPLIVGSHWLVVGLYGTRDLARVYDTTTGAFAFDLSAPGEVRGIADDGTVLLLNGSKALTATASAPAPRSLPLPLSVLDARLAGEQIAFLGFGAAGAVVGLAATSGAVLATASAPSDGAAIADFDGSRLALTTTVCGLEYAEVWDPNDPARLTLAPGQGCPAPRIGTGTLPVRHGRLRLTLRCGSGAGLACEGALSGLALIRRRGGATRRVRLFSPFPDRLDYQFQAGARGSSVIDLGKHALALLRQHPRLTVDVTATAPRRMGVSGPALTSKARIVLRSG